MTFLCPVCNKSYVNKNSLAAHKSRYHKRKEITSKPVYEDIKRKIIQRNDNILDQAENTVKSKEIVKKRPLVMEETSDDSDVEINRGYKRMRSSEGTSTDSNLSTEEDCDEYINRVRLETRKNLRKWKKKRIARKLEKQNMEKKEESIPKLENDESEDQEERHTKQSIRDIECRGLVLETIVESNEKKSNGKFKKIEETQDYIFKENGFIGIPNTEKIWYNSVEIQDLFKDNNHKAIQLNIEKLKNGAKCASVFFKSLGNVTNEEQNLLDTLSEASLFKARALLDQNYDILKSMFTMLPTFDILQEEIAIYKDKENRKHSYNIYKKKLLKDMDIDSPSSEGESTDWGIEATDNELDNSQSKASSSDGKSKDRGDKLTDNELDNSQNKNIIEADSPESKTDESSKLDPQKWII